MSFYLNSIVILLLSIFLTGIFIPQILLIAFRKELFDKIDERKIHKGSVPRLGGLAFTPVICFGLSLVLAINNMAGNDILINSMREQAIPISMSLCSLLATYIVGIADDLIGVRYRAKFIIQIIISIMLIAGGLGVTDLDGLFWIHKVSPWIGWPLTAFFIIFVMNAINLIDGIDGLASGLSSVAFIIYGVFFFLCDERFDALVAFSAFGVLIPFFYFNVFGNQEKRKKIFMGDTGSLTIGLIIALLALRILTMPDHASHNTWTRSPNLMTIVLSPIIVPCFDVVRVYLYRVRKKKNPFLPDKSHLHHKLLAAGMTQGAAMLSIVTMSVTICVFNLYMSKWINLNILILTDIAGLVTWNLLISRKIRNRNQINTIQ